MDERANWKKVLLSIGLILAVTAAGFTATFFIVSKLLSQTPDIVASDAAPSNASPRPETEPTTTPQPTTPATTPAPVTVQPTASKGLLAGKVIVLDPGHQAHADTSQEPIGPGAKETKDKVTGGTSGVKSKVPESKLVLSIGMQLKASLEAQGATVYMTRTSEDVNVSNSQRAAVANDNHADLFLRLHCDGANNSSTHGISMLVPASNQWTAPILESSRSAGDVVQKALIAATGAKNNGVVPRSDLSGFNYCQVPSILVEMGFMTNPEEDVKLNSSAYQQKLVQGLTQGCIDWLSGQ